MQACASAGATRYSIFLSFKYHFLVPTPTLVCICVTQDEDMAMRVQALVGKLFDDWEQGLNDALSSSPMTTTTTTTPPLSEAQNLSAADIEM